MKKKVMKILILVLCICTLLAFGSLIAGCSKNENDYAIVFGDAKIPSVGNGAYENRPLDGDNEKANPDEDDDSDNSETNNSTPDDDYVDPTDGFDCADD